MEWSKAKTILILAFLALNIYLLINLWGYTKGGGLACDEAAQNATLLLQERGVNLLKTCEISRYNSKTPMLNLKGLEYDIPELTSYLLGKKYADGELKPEAEYINGSKSLEFKSDGSFLIKAPEGLFQIDVGDMKAIEKTMNEMIDKMQFDFNEYDIKKFLYNDRTDIILTQKYKNFFVFDNYIEIKVNENGIYEMTCRYKKPAGFGMEEKEILPAYIILLNNYRDAKGLTITGVDIGFKGYQSIEGEMKVMSESQSPAWRITDDSGNIRYFKAYDGEEIK